MTFQQEIASWNPFSKPQNEVKAVPEIGSIAPSTPHFSFPRGDRKSTIIVFLRHCGCPFAEKTLLTLRETAAQNPDIHLIAVSHSDKSSTEKWLQSVGGSGKIEVLVDDQRHSFAEYGLGASSFWAVLNPWSMSSVFALGKQEDIWNRPTESGSRWQTAGVFAVDGAGKITYSHRASTSDDLGDLNAAVKSVKKD
ncbi:hypothetical protein H2198_005395 [Neophaeococcomyces mojaviensis]|uniref:Uncharacterized protein n=1 Tax=Neophaeococcomyces mojaviensis TaxID=3383035 RepID=A0ACC3A5Y9_9EURO|nr:hypothetical protein H2198_005395 [Knufia sp. JES_112]